MKNRTVIILSFIHASLCALMGIAAFMAILIDAAAKGITDDPRLFLLPAFFLASAAIILVWQLMYRRNLAVRTRSVVGFFSIVSAGATAFVMLIILYGLLRHWCGGLEIGGAESRLCEPSTPKIHCQVEVCLEDRYLL